MEADEERLKALKLSVLCTVRKILEEKTQIDEQHTTYSDEVIEQLTELLFEFIQRTAEDLEVFARHGGRKKINADDVLLFARNNEPLLDYLKSVLEQLTTNATEENDDKKKRKKKVRS